MIIYGRPPEIGPAEIREIGHEERFSGEAEPMKRGRFYRRADCVRLKEAEGGIEVLESIERWGLPTELLSLEEAVWRLGVLEIKC